MVNSDGNRAVRRARVYRSVAEKRRIVELTLSPGASVSHVAQAEGVNSHQVFDWRRAYRNGERAAIYSLIGSAKLSGLDPELYPRTVLAQIADHPVDRIGDLLPWNLTATLQPAAQAA